MFDRLLHRLAANQRSRRWLIPLLRAYIRHAPLATGKQRLWQSVVNPYFAWAPHRFVARTVFGSIVEGDTKDIIQQYIYYFGLWEPHITRWIQHRLAPGDTFIDVGANIGYYALLAARCVGPAGRVVAIEPSPTTFRRLQANLARNRAHNVLAVNAAVSDRRTTVKLFHGPEANDGLTTMIEEVATKLGCSLECEVEAAPLGELVSPQVLRNARLIKIDVEGAEWPVVSGMARFLDCGRHDLEIIVEVCPTRLAHHGKCANHLLRLFDEAGFQAYYLENDYRASSYLAPSKELRPAPLLGPIESEMDLVFSRQDAALV